MPTVRRQLIELLSDEPRSTSSLARELGLRRGDVEEQLHHAVRSAIAAGHIVEVIPARCKDCGFVFGTDRVSKPGRCPSCKGSRLFEPLVRLAVATIDIDPRVPPFDRFGSVQRLAAVRSGHASSVHARHQLYVGRDKQTRANMLIKVTSKPGVVYEQDLANETSSLSTINRELPDSRYFPVLGDHGRLRDRRMYLTMSLFDEWPLATTIESERRPDRQVAHLRTAIEVAKALAELHGLQIWHVDLNPMNILSRWESGRPTIRLVDFESSYEVARHSKGRFYNPPTTSGFSAPELSRQPPDARSDLFSLGAVLYTMLAGYEWSWANEIGQVIGADPEVAPELKEILLTAVDKDPDRRFPSVVELRAALAGHLESIWPGRVW